MAFPITYNGIEGLTDITAKIRRKLDGKYFDGGWGTDSSLQLAHALTESAAVPGEYTGEANFTPANGGVYIISVYSGSLLLFEMESLYRSRQRTILNIINELQRWLRLPESTEITDGHAALLLSFANEVQLDYMTEFCQWEEQKLRGAFRTQAGIAVYALSPLQSGVVDYVTELKIDSAPPLIKPSETAFRDIIRTAPDQAQPTSYNHYGRAGSSLLIELAPTPDAIYRVDFSLLLKPARLVNADDIPLLDGDTILLGMKYLARKDQGEDYQAELATFQAKISLRAGTHGESDSQGIDFL